MTSPPGGGSSISPQRASIGPASRIDARIFLQRYGSSFVGADRLGVDLEGVAAAPVHVRARRGDELDERLDVANARNVLERDRMLGEERRADDRQRGVLVSRRANGSGELPSPFDDELQCAHVRSVDGANVRIREE